MRMRPSESRTRIHALVPVVQSAQLDDHPKSDLPNWPVDVLKYFLPLAAAAADDDDDAAGGDRGVGGVGRNY